ncbi:DNA-3-methyladenine glycosylase I [Litoreibacter roseus]|uniref:3-methyladenine DNA glycosylase n=1 Tax=Litoreibacter roseus TaxID=2601869 RepID=A0A6N6JJP4_9RHOB|nr:DNA-3-methyladenine glycosylase I [Litoreibacter roseus]GFE66070.1 3-methyladenine DNA glycosylase [Litoreibacter roseus]
MRTFDEILAISVGRKGDEVSIFDGFEPPKPPAELALVPDDRWLAGMTRAIFQAGFNWKVVDRMWPGFEAAFAQFDIGRNALMSEDRFDELCKDTSIVRYPQKIQSVQQNAVFIQDVAKEHGSFGAFIGNWPQAEFSGLLERLKKDGTRLGGTTGQYFLRFMGADGYILSKDVTARLIAEGVIDKPPTSKAALAAVQNAVNTWSGQSDRSLKAISRVLATSCG